MYTFQNFYMTIELHLLLLRLSIIYDKLHRSKSQECGEERTANL